MFHVYKYIYIVYTHLCKYIERESEREREHVDLRIDLMRSKLVIYFDFNGYYVYTHVTSCDSLVLLIPSGKLTKNYGKSPFSMGKSTISMVILNS